MYVIRCNIRARVDIVRRLLAARGFGTGRNGAERQLGSGYLSSRRLQVRAQRRPVIANRSRNDNVPFQ